MDPCHVHVFVCDRKNLGVSLHGVSQVRTKEIVSDAAIYNVNQRTVSIVRRCEKVRAWMLFACACPLVSNKLVNDKHNEG